MKTIKVALSLIFLVFIIFCIVYKNVLAPHDKDSLYAKLADLSIPLSMMFSMFLIFLQNLENKKGKKKLSKDERNSFSQVGSAKDDNSL